jgi:hypothetical protein
VRRRSLEGLSSPQEVLFLAGLLGALWVLNVVDLAVTVWAVDHHRAREANRLMAALLGAGTVPATAFKLGLVTLGVVLLWWLRRRRWAVAAAGLLTAVFASLVTYELLWIVVP